MALNRPISTVGRQSGLGDDDFAGVAGGDEFAVNEDDAAGAKAGLGPLDFAGGQLDALKRTVAVFLELEHTIKMAVDADRSAPVIHQFVRFAPNLLRGIFAAIFADTISRSSNTVSGGAINDITIDDG